MSVAIVLFSDDFRLVDNPALALAAKKYDNIIPLYIYNKNYLGRELGSASKVFLHKILESFSKLLREKYNAELIIKSGEYPEVITEICKQMRIDAIYFNHSHTLAQIQNEETIRHNFTHLDVQSFKAKLLFDPWEIKPGSGSDFYKVFTPFSKECLKNTDKIQPSHPAPKSIKSLHNIQGIPLENLQLIPKNQGKWCENLLNHWKFSYDEITQDFLNFVDLSLEKYSIMRNIPASNGNSGISPYLRFGIISPKMCFNAVASAVPNINHQFILELLWREFAYHVMFFNQDIATKELKPQYANFTWNSDENLLEKWQKGNTGFDIVDSGMLELWRTGVMHGRIRMVVASFLIKDLLLDWRLGEQWFWETLVDADPAINPFSWQWVFGSGFDAAPYFRIFNPDSQKEKFDPNGTYCKKWLPQNWQPQRVVSHDIQRKITLERYKDVNKLQAKNP